MIRQFNKVINQVSDGQVLVTDVLTFEFEEDTLKGTECVLGIQLKVIHKSAAIDSTYSWEVSNESAPAIKERETDEVVHDAHHVIDVIDFVKL